MTDYNETNPVDEFDLAQFDAEYAAVGIETRESPPDGTYQVIVEGVDLTRAKTSGNPILKWALRILNGPRAGSFLYRNNPIATSDNIRWLKTDLSRSGLYLEKFSELPANLDRLLDVKLEVVKRTRGGNENVFINRRLEVGDIDDDDGAAVADARGQV